MKNHRQRYGLLSLLFVLLFSFQAAAAELSVRTHPLERNGVPLFLQSMSADLPSPPLGQMLLVHGLTFSSHEFDLNYKDYSLARWLANRGYVVWMLDIAGYARSGPVQDGFMPDSDYAAEDINAAVDAIIKASGQTSVDVLGWSWGTVTSGRFAAKYPEKVRSLVLYAPIVAGLIHLEVKDPFKSEAWKGADEDFQRGADGKIDPALTEAGVVKLFDANCLQYDSRPVPNGGRRDLLVSPNTRLIPTAKIQAPVLIIVGSKDGYVSVELAKEAAAGIPGGAELLVFKDGGHALFMEKPHYRAFRQAVLDFVTRQAQ
jgi:pimeloyl-ACP methyl ester carboxylesterase